MALLSSQQVWMVSFMATVCLDVIWGLVVGIAFSLMTLVYKLQRPKTSLMGQVLNTEFFVPVKKFEKVEESPEIKIFHFGGAMHFANAEFFRDRLEESLGFSIVQLKREISKQLKKGNSQDSLQAVKDGQFYERGVRTLEISKSKQICVPRVVVLDFSRVSWMDGCSVNVLRSVATQYAEVGITVCVAACSPALFRFLKKSGAVDEISAGNFFPSVFDAVRTFRLNDAQENAQVISVVASL